MALDYGRQMLSNISQAPQHQIRPNWGAFGNLRAHILLVLQQMGWGNDGPLDCKRVLQLFHDQLNEEVLCQLIMEDIQYWCDPELQGAHVVGSTHLITEGESSRTQPGFEY